ncbi:MAG: hypothetical protein JO108_06295 [Acidobacteriaceae bacterium]|nr:hypothetical protein [Acidobacteriaceae bacterium]
MGPEDTSQVIDVSLFYNPQSPNYRHWLSPADFVAMFAPSDGEVKTVEDSLTAQNLQIVSVGPDNFFAGARGTLGDVEAAFQVNIDHFNVNGQIYRANTAGSHKPGADIGQLTWRPSIPYERHQCAASGYLQSASSGKWKLPAWSFKSSVSGRIWRPLQSKRAHRKCEFERESVSLFGSYFYNRAMSNTDYSSPP